MKSMFACLSQLSLLGTILLPMTLWAAGAEPSRLTVHLDEQVTPLDLRALQNGQSRTLEHNGHKVVVRREKGQLDLQVNGQKLPLGVEGGDAAGPMTCVVKVGHFSVEHDALSRASAENVLEAGPEGAVWVEDKKTLHLKTADGQTETVTVTEDAGKVRVTTRDAQGQERTLVERTLVEPTLIEPTLIEPTLIDAAGTPDGKTKKVIVLSSGGDDASLAAALTDADVKAEDGKRVIVRKHVVAEKTEAGVEGRKVVVRCVGDAPPGSEGGDKKVIIIRKVEEKETP